MPVGRPVALRIIAENSTGFDQCRNGANVVTESSVICPPNETPTAHGAGRPDMTASSAQSMVSCLMTSTTDSGESSSSGRSWQPVTICPIAFTATAVIWVVLIFIPTNVRALATMRNPVCGRPRRSVFSFCPDFCAAFWEFFRTKSFGSLPPCPAAIGVSSITPA